MRMPKTGEKILVRQGDGENWEEMTVKRRGGKAGAKGKVKNPMYFNLRPSDISEDIPIDVTNERDCGKHLDSLGWMFSGDDEMIRGAEKEVAETPTEAEIIDEENLVWVWRKLARTRRMVAPGGL